MQFISNGPDIPEALLQAHEEGRVVFFCGSGISHKVGLKNFKWLVDRIYRLCRTNQTVAETKAYQKNAFDTVLNLLENRLPGQRAGMEMRKALADALQPNLNLDGATDTHLSLLQLALTREDSLRLVTTNFDRTFEEIAKSGKFQFTSFSAPLLPVAKSSQWNGLVYLHGLLPNDKKDNRALDKLVVTSGDFGLAYLFERWASRFVSDMFRNFVVCFVGYSIDDPVLRYMMDAIAAERQRGESPPNTYALASFESGEEQSKKVDWKSKGVVPILYNSTNKYVLLHDTLKIWANDYRDGIRGKERVVVEHGTFHPTQSTKQDDFVGRMLWALSDKSGLPAKLFADLNPVPPLAWLDIFSEPRYKHKDLSRFGVPSHRKVDDDLRFSLIRRPASYTLTPWMKLNSASDAEHEWDEVIIHLARWLTRHLNDPKLVIWLAEQGGQLHHRFVQLIESKLCQFEDLESIGNDVELKATRKNAPNSIPSLPMRTLWRLLLTGQVISTRRQNALLDWKNRVERDGLSKSLRLELRKLLAPKIILRKPQILNEVENSSDANSSIQQLVDWEIVLETEGVKSFISIFDDCNWRKVLLEMFDDFQQLLDDALGLLQELENDEKHGDSSILDMPSISPHYQNWRFKDWVTLIELVRDSWLEALKDNPERASRVAKVWFDKPYPTFKRLALFAASHDNVIAPDEWVQWLMEEDARWLWSPSTMRETLRLLVLQGKNLTSKAKKNLEATIITGPPKSLYPNISSDKWASIKKDRIWLRLAKLAYKDDVLGSTALSILREVPPQRSDWQSERVSEKNEFSLWMSDYQDPDFKEQIEIDIAPRKRQQLVAWLKKTPQETWPYYEHTWKESCRTRFFHSLFALCDLSREGLWPTEHWREALQVWSEDGLVERSWHFAGTLVERMPDDTLRELAQSVSWWLLAVSKSTSTRHLSIKLKLCHRLLKFRYRDDVFAHSIVTTAINHPVGYVTQVLLNIWLMRQPNDNDKLPEEIKPFFTQLCDKKIQQFCLGRVLLASRLIALFRVDSKWTETNLLPFFDWSTNQEEAQFVWQGFLMSPRLHQPLLIEFKSYFLNTVNYYDRLGALREQFARFLTYIALNRVEGYTVQELQSATAALPQKGLQCVAQTLVQALQGSGEQRENFWKNRIQPFWKEIWPKSNKLVSGNIAEFLAILTIETRDEFSEALDEVFNWLQKIKHPYYVIHKLNTSKLSKRFPNEALRLLYVVIDEQHYSPSPELRDCLNAIAETSPKLKQDQKYRSLDTISRQYGQ